jgi:hypothetical protein
VKGDRPGHTTQGEVTAQQGPVNNTILERCSDVVLLCQHQAVTCKQQYAQ